METLDLNAVARMGLILAHLLAFAMAAVGIAFGDLAIFRKRRVDAALHTVIAEHARQLLGPFADDFLAENGVRAADIERNPARAVVRIGKLLEEIDPAHREAFDRMTARKLRGELAEAA